MGTLFWSCCVTIFYVYLGYYACLRLAGLFVRCPLKFECTEFQPAATVSVLVAAHNEQENIEPRIRNLLEADYPGEKLEIIIGSDGSSDGTVQRAEHFVGVQVLEFRENRGRAAVQNDMVEAATGEVVFFTDAETVFEPSFLKNALKAFADSLVGCVVGNLVYRTQREVVSDAEGLYFKLEKSIRAAESRLGLLATATGACMGVRKTLWRKLGPIDDCDFTTPLDVVMQGYRVVYTQDAVAYDVPPSGLISEIRSRTRQTSKNLVGTLRRWGWSGWVRHPLISWGLVSHKILRWLTPFFLVGALCSNIFLLRQNVVYQWTFGTQIVFYCLALLGLAGHVFSRRIPLASTVLSFCAANIGMGLGVIKGFTGKAPARY